jgi:hypothetical protein
MFDLTKTGFVAVTVLCLATAEIVLADTPCLAPEMPSAGSLQTPPTEMFSVTRLTGHEADEYLIYLESTYHNLALDTVWLQYISGDKLLLAAPIEASPVSDSQVMFAIALDRSLQVDVRIRWSYIEPAADCPALEHFESHLIDQ